MQDQTLPVEPITTPPVFCGAHDTDVLAEVEDYYVAFPGTADERGGTFARCRDEACERASMEFISTVGDFVETVEIVRVAA